MEDGIAETGGVLIINKTVTPGDQSTHLDKTWQEIYDALMAGKNVILKEDESYGTLTSIFYQDDIYSVYFGGGTYSANSINDFPGTPGIG